MKKEIVDKIRLHLLRIYLEEYSDKDNGIKIDKVKGGEIENEI